MHRALSIAFLLVFFLPVPSITAGESTIRVSGSSTAAARDFRSISVFTPDIKEVFASVSLAVPGKARVEFTWRTPDGAVFSLAFKTAFPGKDPNAAAVWDSVRPEGIEGWWRVDAGFDGEFLSKRFLLTKNRQILAVVSGNRDAALRVIREADPASGPGRDLLTVAAANHDAGLRAAALSRMAGMHEDWATEAVREGLADPDAEVRLAALGSADALPEAERERAYISALASPEAAFRLAAAAGLAGLDGDKAHDALMGALTDTEPGVRMAALSILAGSRAPGLDARLAGLVADPDPGVADTALEAALALPDSDVRARALAAAAMSGRREFARRAADALLPAGAEAALPAYMRHFRDGYRREDMLRAMSSVTGGNALGLIAEAYRVSGNDERLRFIAVSGLAGRGGGASEVLDEALSDPSASVRLEAVKSAETLPDEGDKAALLGRALSDGDPAVRKRALAGLADIGTREAFLKLLDALDDPALGEDALERLGKYPLTQELMGTLATRGRTVADSRARRRVVVMLARAGLDAADMGKYLGDPDPDIRKTALDALRGMGTEDSRAAAMDALGDERLQGDALGYIKSGLTPALAELLAARGHGVSGSGFRRSIVEAAARGGARVETVGGYLDDPDRGVRKSALDALAEDGTPEAYSLIMGGIDDPALRDVALEHVKKGLTLELTRVLAEKGHAAGDAGFRGRVVKALSAGGAGGGELLMEYLDDPEPDVGYAALRSLADIIARDGDAGLLGRLAARGRVLPDPGLRLRVVGALADLGAGVSALSGYLDDQDPVVGRAALDALTGLGTQEAHEAVAGSLDDPVLRDAILRRVERGAAPALMELLAQKGRGLADAGFRLKLVRMLATGGLGASEFTDYLSDPNPDVRAAAVNGLSSLKGPEAAYGLFLAGRDHDARIRDAALGGLMRMGPEELEGALGLLFGRGAADEEVVGFISGGIKERRVHAMLVNNIPAGDDSRMGAALLPLINDNDIGSGSLDLVKDGLSPALLERLADRGRLLAEGASRERLVKTLAGKGLGAYGLIPYLDDPDPEVRAAAVAGLASLGDAGGAYGLFLAGRDPKKQIRQAAGDWIGKMDGQALSGGLNLLFEKGGAGWETIGFAAETVRDASVLKTLVEKIPPDDTARLGAALRPLMKRGGDEAVPALAEGLKAGDESLAAAVVRSLAAMDGPAAGNALTKAYGERPALREMILDGTSAGVHAGDVIGLALGGEDPGLRRRATSLIGKLTGGRAAGLIAAALSDPDERVRMEAVSSAGRLGDAEGLVRAARDSSPGVRAAAADGLSALSGGRAAEALGTLVLDADTAVSETALHGLERMGGDVPAAVWAAIANASGKREAKIASLKALGKTPDSEYAAVIARALADGDDEVADAAQEQLKGIGKAALHAVHPLLEDTRARDRALDVVAAAHDPSSEGPVISVLPLLEGPSLARAIGALGKLGGDRSLDTFSRMYPGADEATRIAILRAVSGLDLSGGEPALAEVLSDALANGSEAARFYAVRAVGEKRVSALKGRLSAMLGSEGSALVRREIERALGML